MVLDKDSKFLGVFRQVVDLLQLNCHTLSGSHHDGQLVERVKRFMNKGLRVMVNERDSVRVALESILLLIYARNSSPIPGTDLSRSLIAVGRKFAFPIDFSATKHLEFTSSPLTVKTYSKTMAELLDASCKVVTVLLEEHRAYHRELVNSRRRDPRVWKKGDIVFAHRTTKSNAAVGKVGKLMFPVTDP